MLLSKGKITPDHNNLLKSWKHSGFQVFSDPRIHPRKKEAMENMARYIIRASFSQERMTYLPEESRIKENKWSAITVSIVTFYGEFDKKKMRMPSSHVS